MHPNQPDLTRRSLASGSLASGRLVPVNSAADSLVPVNPASANLVPVDPAMASLTTASRATASRANLDPVRRSTMVELIAHMLKTRPMAFWGGIWVSVFLISLVAIGSLLSPSTAERRSVSAIAVGSDSAVATQPVASRQTPMWVFGAAVFTCTAGSILVSRKLRPASKSLKATSFRSQSPRNQFPSGHSVGKSPKRVPHVERPPVPVFPGSFAGQRAVVPPAPKQKARRSQPQMPKRLSPFQPSDSTQLMNRGSINRDTTNQGSSNRDTVNRGSARDTVNRGFEMNPGFMDPGLLLAKRVPLKPIKQVPVKQVPVKQVKQAAAKQASAKQVPVQRALSTKSRSAKRSSAKQLPSLLSRLVSPKQGAAKRGFAKRGDSKYMQQKMAGTYRPRDQRPLLDGNTDRLADMVDLRQQWGPDFFQ